MPANHPDDLHDIFDIVSNEYKADVYIYSGYIGDSGFGQLVKQISHGRKQNSCILILTTRGGSANSAYQIARLLQQTYDEFILCAPSYCKSAGTIVALGAHRLIMDDFSELGPLDVQLYRTDELGASKSGLLTKSAFDSLSDVSFSLFEELLLKIFLKGGGLISFRLASDISVTMAAQLMAPIYGQINPDIVGSDFRDPKVALEYGLRLAKIAKNASIEAVEKLVTDYPSHDFIIDHAEGATFFDMSISLPRHYIGSWDAWGA